MDIDIDARMHVCMYVRTYVRTYISMHIYIYTNTCMVVSHEPGPKNSRQGARLSVATRDPSTKTAGRDPVGTSTQQRLRSPLGITHSNDIVMI